VNSIETSPEEFKCISARVLEIATEYLQELKARAISPRERGTELRSFYRSPIPDSAMVSEAISALADIVRHSRAQNGPFFGYALGSGDPVAVATDALCSVRNQNVTA
jgi:hypothetical protein